VDCSSACRVHSTVTARGLCDCPILTRYVIGSGSVSTAVMIELNVCGGAVRA
jgi:hypothetical protein